MTVATTEQLIAPHGGTLVDRTDDRPGDVEQLEVVTLTSVSCPTWTCSPRALSSRWRLHGREDYERVVEEMRLAGGLPWALPGLPRRGQGA